MRFRRFILLAFIAAAFAAGGFFVGVRAQNTGGKVKVTEIFKQDLADMPGKEVRILQIDNEPGAGSPAHRHPGHTFVYVVEGQIESQVEGQPLKTYKAGDCFYEAPNGVHAVSRNSSDKPAKFIAFMVKDKDKPPTTLAPQAPK